MPDEQPITRTEMVVLLTDLQHGLKRELKSELRQDLKQDLQALKQEIFERMDAAELRSREHTERIETRLLTGFHNWVPQ